MQLRPDVRRRRPVTAFRHYWVIQGVNCEVLSHPIAAARYWVSEHVRYDVLNHPIAAARYWVAEHVVADVLSHPITGLGLVVALVRDGGTMNGNDAWRAVAELAASQHGAFTRTQAASKEIDAQRLRRAANAGRIRKALSDVFVFASAPDSWMQRHAIVSQAGGVISHQSAAALHGLDGFVRAGPLVCGSFARGAERRIDNVRVHRWRYTSRHDIAVVDGIRCTSVARTLFQLGSVCSRDEVEAALDSALRQGANPIWIEDTADRLRRPGPTGGNVLNNLMYDPERAGALSESVLETVIERVLNESRLPRAVRQQAVCLRSGERRLDLAFPDVRLGIEGHSRKHHWGRQPEDADSLRDLELAAAGWEVLYITWKLAHQPEKLLDLVVATYDQRRRLIFPAA